MNCDGLFLIAIVADNTLRYDVKQPSQEDVIGRVPDNVNLNVQCNHTDKHQDVPGKT